jgi:hypothetical protein
MTINMSSSASTAFRLNHQSVTLSRYIPRIVITRLNTVGGNLGPTPGRNLWMSFQKMTAGVRKTPVILSFKLRLGRVTFTR